VRKRLVLIAAAITSMVTLAFAVPLGTLVQTLAVERVLGVAEVSARALAPVLADPGTSADVEAAVELTAATVPGTLTIHLPEGARLGPATERDAALLAASEGEASRSRTADGWRVLVPVVRSDGIAVVDVAVPTDAARAGVGQAWAVLAALAVALVAGAVLVADRLGRTTVAAVRQLGSTAERLGAGDLTARAEVDDPPEVAAVATTLRTLADRIRRLLAAEREAAADMSHRIRTPLMALRLDVEALPRTAAAERLTEDVDALERAVDAVIHDARRSTEDRSTEVVDLAEMVRSRGAFWSVLAEDQGRRLDLVVSGAPANVRGHRDELTSALDALLGNVFAHTPEGVGFALRLHTEPDGHAIVVEDDGPGLPDELVLARGVSEAGSTGLGLDIARQAVESAGGALRWERSATGGARITLEFPRSDLGPAITDLGRS
jgi:signal transduction histidine kinase